LRPSARETHERWPRSDGISGRERERAADRPTSAERAATLVWFLDTGGFDRQRFRIVNRLRALHDSDEFATLPEDLRARIREIVADTER
jgi:hypothetical protein